MAAQKIKVCKEDGNCLDADSVCEPCVEFRQQWSSSSGRTDGLGTAAGILEKAAADYFVAQKDDMARAFRSMAVKIRELQTAESAKLQGFINKAHPKKNT